MNLFIKINLFIFSASAYRLGTENRKAGTNSLRMDSGKLQKYIHRSISDIIVCKNRFRNLKSSAYGKGMVNIGTSILGNTYIQQL